MIGDKNWTKSISKLVGINPVTQTSTIFRGSMPRTRLDNTSPIVAFTAGNGRDTVYSQD